MQPPDGLIIPDHVIKIPKSLKKPMLGHLRKYHGISTDSMYNELQGKALVRSERERTSRKEHTAAMRVLAAVTLSALALAGCGSEPDRPSGPEADPAGTPGAVTALVFADSALQSAVEQAAAETGDAAGLVSLTAKDRGIADLGGIEQLARLEVLDLYGNEIRDLSPLAGLKRLRYLDLGATGSRRCRPWRR